MCLMCFTFDKNILNNMMARITYVFLIVIDFKKICTLHISNS